MPAPGEAPDAFVKRLEILQENLHEMEEKLKKEGKYSIEGMEVHPGERIPETLFAAPGEMTRRLYGFQCQWVPGFFTDPRHSLLFGGTAFYFYPRLFAMFIIRSCFRTRRKWLWYQRDELLAHELCHVARLPLNSSVYEEHVAYQSALSPFRRATGGIFHAEREVLAFLLATLLLLAWQALRTFACPFWPVWPGWLPLVIVTMWLVGRHIRDTGTFNAAGRKLAEYYGSPEKGRIALFHCTDGEIQTMAKTSDISAEIERLSQSELRWKILQHRLKG